jgi:hypothetical protein
MVGGPVRALAAVLRFGWSFGSAFLLSAGCSFAELEGVNCAKASRTRTFAVGSATPAGAETFASVTPVVAGVIVGRVVSNTMRSGHFRSECILITERLAAAFVRSSAGNFGKYPSTTNRSVSNAAPTKKKYRAKGISGSLHPRDNAEHELNRG